jgi:hypothetical protein
MAFPQIELLVHYPGWPLKRQYRQKLLGGDAWYASATVQDLRFALKTKPAGE